MNRRLIVATGVSDEIQQIARYIANDNPTAALRFITAVNETFSRLTVLPGLGRRWKPRHPRLHVVRCTAVIGFRSFRVFFRALPDAVQILHVLHGARDLDALLNDDHAPPAEPT